MSEHKYTDQAMPIVVTSNPKMTTLNDYGIGKIGPHFYPQPEFDIGFGLGLGGISSGSVNTQQATIREEDTAPYFPLTEDLMDEIVANKISEIISPLKKTINSLQREILQLKKAKNYERLLEFSEFKENWNGYEAPKFNKKLLELAKSYLFDERLKSQPTISPTGDATILFEFEFASSNVEIEISDDNIDLIIVNKRSKEIEEIYNIDWNKVLSILNGVQ